MLNKAPLDRIQTVLLDWQVMSVVTLAGLLYGVEILSRRKQHRSPQFADPAIHLTMFGIEQMAAAGAIKLPSPRLNAWQQ